MNKEFLTISKYADAEIIIDKSKFIGYVKPVTDEAEAEAFILSIKNMHKEATHNVPVYLIGEHYEIQRYSDDGEPSGTAGMPVLEMLKKEGITNIAMVITRYFGGIKLGTGGLVRAYTKTAKTVLEKAGIVRKAEHELVSIIIDYSFLGKVQNMLTEGRYIVKDTVFLENVQFLIYTLPEEIDRLKETIVNTTNNQCEIKLLGREYVELRIDN